MKDQITGIYILPVVLQVLAPLALLAWQAYGQDRSRAGWLLKAAAVAAYLIAISLAGLWLFLPWYLSLVYLWICAALIIAALERKLQTAWWPRPFRGKIEIAARGALAIGFVVLALYALSGWQPPNEDSVDLDFPLRHGTYYVVGGGSNGLINPHIRTLTGDRYAAYRGQSYGVDIVKVNAVGMRAAGAAPRDPGKYGIFGTDVYAPCAGTIIRAEDGHPDMPPPEPDRAYLTGNSVLLQCGNRHVLLGHFRRGTVRVRPGDPVAVGTVLGQVGNSGNTGEPHLHIHAQRPSATTAFAGGDPLPIIFNGRYLARNAWVRHDVSLFAPPVGGAVLLMALFVAGLMYRLPLRRWFKTWGSTRQEQTLPMAADGEVENPDYRTTLAVTIQAPPAAVWPWLVQIGNGRGGLYSYDWLDRIFGVLEGPSADSILPEFQSLSVGDVIPLAGSSPGFPVKAIEPGRVLLLAGRSDDVHWAWQFQLVADGQNQTRLISRNCARVPRTFRGAAFTALIEPTAFIMTRKMLLGIKCRAEMLQPKDVEMPARAA